MVLDILNLPILGLARRVSFPGPAGFEFLGLSDSPVWPAGRLPVPEPYPRYRPKRSGPISRLIRGDLPLPDRGYAPFVAAIPTKKFRFVAANHTAAQYDPTGFYVFDADLVRVG
jgi:hypothetical protein